MHSPAPFCWSLCVPLPEDFSLAGYSVGRGGRPELIVFARAARIVQGQVPYRDFFEIVTPGTDLLYAARVSPVWHSCLDHADVDDRNRACVSVVITYIANKILSGPIVWLPALLFLVFDFNSALDLTHQWFSSLAALAVAAVLMGGSSARRMFSASLLCAIAILFTQTKGALVFVGVALYLVCVTVLKPQDSHVGRRLALFILPALLAVTCALGYYVYEAGFQRVLFDLFIFPSRFMPLSEVNTPRT